MNNRENGIHDDPLKNPSKAHNLGTMITIGVIIVGVIIVIILCAPLACDATYCSPGS